MQSVSSALGQLGQLGQFGQFGQYAQYAQFGHSLVSMLSNSASAPADVAAHAWPHRPPQPHGRPRDGAMPRLIQPEEVGHTSPAVRKLPHRHAPQYLLR